MCAISMYSVLNTLSEYTYFYLSKNISSYQTLLHIKKHFFNCFWIVESSQCVLCDVVKNDVLKKTECDELVKKVNNIKTNNDASWKSWLCRKISKIRNKILGHYHDKYFNTQEFNKLT